MKSLAKQLDAFLQALLERVEPATAAVLQRAEQARTELMHTQRAIGVGDLAPDFTLPDQHGKPVSLHDALAHGPLVLTFYRGGWCPYCTISLRAMNRIVPELQRAGATLLAISPQTRANSLTTAERNGLAFPLLSDASNAVARRYGLAWSVDPELRALFQRLGHDLPRINATPDWELPLAAGYVIARDGHVVAAEVDPRAHRRLEPAAALDAVRKLQPQPAQ